MKTDSKDSLSRTISAQIARLIRERVLSGVYPAGTQLIQDSIAAEFGVSKIPIREALVQLSTEGLVDIYAHRGFQVRPLSVAEAEEVFNLRIQIEPMACAEGARRATEQDRADVQRAFEALQRKLLDENFEGMDELHMEFHRSMTAPRRQPTTAEIVGRLVTMSQRYGRAQLDVAGMGPRSAQEHMDILLVWQTGRPKEIARAVRSHIETTKQQVKALLKNGS